MLVFVALAIAGFLAMAGSALFGHDHDGGLDHDHDHDAHHDFDHDNEPTISIFSTKVIGTFIMGFGATGAIARYYGFSMPGSSMLGLGGGLLMGGAMYGVFRMIYSQQSSSLIETSSVVGDVGTVQIAIGRGTPGRVLISKNGQQQTYFARSADGKGIAKNRSVRVVSHVGSELVVEETALAARGD
jgi:membrane-bound ClpP family serine protease